MLGSLAQAIGGSSSNNLVKNNASPITTQLGGVTNFVNAVQPNGSNPPGTTPQAYCTILFFDERFNFISSADGGVAQAQVASTVGSNGATLNLTNIKAPKNGYVYVYVSNQSNEAVYFDNFKVTIDAGNIIEENHYYAYGLKIAAISSKKAGDSYEGVLKNNYLYNGKELFEDGDLNWYDYGFRNYDPQIGRFTQLDPMTDKYPFFAPYLYAANDPINKIDFEGLGPIDEFANVPGALIGEVVMTGVRHTAKVLPAVTNLALNVTSLGLNIAAGAARILNGNFNSDQVGKTIDPNNFNPRNPREPFNVFVGGLGPVVVGVVQVQREKEWLNPDHPERDGIDIWLNYLNYSSSYKDFKWIQAVRTNSTEAQAKQPIIREFNDPLKKDDNLPFHFTLKQMEDENLTDGVTFSRFYDAPSRAIGLAKSDARNERHPMYWQGELTLVGKYKGRYVAMITLKYGFSINSDGVTTLQYLEEESPSNFQKKEIKRANMGLLSE